MHFTLYYSNSKGLAGVEEWVRGGWCFGDDLVWLLTRDAPDPAVCQPLVSVQCGDAAHVDMYVDGHGTGELSPKLTAAGFSHCAAVSYGFCTVPLWLRCGSQLCVADECERIVFADGCEPPIRGECLQYDGSYAVGPYPRTWRWREGLRWVARLQPGTRYGYVFEVCGDTTLFEQLWYQRGLPPFDECERSGSRPWSGNIYMSATSVDLEVVDSVWEGYSEHGLGGYLHKIDLDALRA